jgi:3-phenylpropionate/trans-cinnamate dioxygenase ferredoxin subunit
MADGRGKLQERPSDAVTRDSDACSRLLGPAATSTQGVIEFDQSGRGRDERGLLISSTKVAPFPTQGSNKMNAVMTTWVEACNAEDIDREDVARFDHAGRAFAIYRSPDDSYYATDGICTHEKAFLGDGLVMGNIVECPKHNGRFDYRTGEAKGAPVCINLRSYPVKVEGGRVLIEIS